MDFKLLRKYMMDENTSKTFHFVLKGLDCFIEFKEYIAISKTLTFGEIEAEAEQLDYPVDIREWPVNDLYDLIDKLRPVGSPGRKEGSYQLIFRDKDKLEKTLLKIIKDYERSNGELPTVEYIAVYLGFSKRQLERKFKALFGITLGAWKNNDFLPH